MSGPYIHRVSIQSIYQKWNTTLEPDKDSTLRKAYSADRRRTTTGDRGNEFREYNWRVWYGGRTLVCMSEATPLLYRYVVYNLMD